MGLSQHNLTEDGQPVTEHDAAPDHCKRCRGTVFFATFVLVRGERRGFGVACLSCREPV